MSKEKKKILHQLYIELVKLQKEIISSDLKLLVILEGRDAAGKDGTIKVITRHLSPRETRIIALGKPSDMEEKEWYFQRYSEFLPRSGEFVLFNRSWYNRLGVEKVMGFCTEKQYQSFFDEVKHFEKMLFNAGFIILKYYLDISKQEQSKRLKERETDPLKQWKVSPVDKVAIKHWNDYSEARNEMLEKTDFSFAPWYVVNANNKEDAHIALISHLLSKLKYKDKIKYSHHNKLITAASEKNFKDKLFR
jgi:polyphosphate kinase 2